MVQVGERRETKDDKMLSIKFKRVPAVKESQSDKYEQLEDSKSGYTYSNRMRKEDTKKQSEVSVSDSLQGSGTKPMGSIQGSDELDYQEGKSVHSENKAISHTSRPFKLKNDSNSHMSNPSTFDGKKSVNIKKTPLLTEKIKLDYREPTI